MSRHSTRIRNSVICAISITLLSGGIVGAQSSAPVVTMNVTTPDGRVRELSAPESGLATLTMSDGSEYAFRPTIQDSMPWNRIVVTIFRTATSMAEVESLGELAVNRGGPAVQSKTNPSFTIAVPAVSAAGAATTTE